ncbi:MAG: sulfite exporter TauE/SafE family protein [Rubellimicrobium sp.]|nr:sulfite exporter TauE/SafE family protein [Rubellimicrobium sp.]
MPGTPFTDPWTLAVGLLGAVIIGLAKGGLGGVGILGVPVLALIMSPVQAAGILLPVLIVTDGFSLRAWWKSWDNRTLALMMPGAIIGIAIGWATAALVSDAVVRLIVGVIAVLFVLRWATQGQVARARQRNHNAPAATIWGGLAGYTSFVAHAGAPPFSVYTMPLRLDPKLLTGTSVVFFAIVNVIKLVPYFALGQFDTSNLTASAMMIPVAVVFVFVGAWIIRQMRAEVFYPFTYAMVMLVGMKMIWDGWAEL